MDIKLVNRPPSLTSTDFACYFFEAGSGYHANSPHAPKRASERPEALAAGKNVELVFNIDAYRDYDRADARRVAGGTALRYARKWGGADIVWHLDGAVPVERFRELVTGLLLAEYEYREYKSEPVNYKPSVKRLTIVAGNNAAAFRRELPRLLAIDAGVRTARDLANAPGMDLGPQELIAKAKEVAQRSGLGFKQLAVKQLEAGGYVGLTFVGRGSVRPPGLCVLTYTPAKSAKGVEPLCLVGKGVTFDTGGISIKPWDGMWDMKADMSGAACVIGAMEAIAALKLPIPVTAVVVTAENMPDGDAYRPGDILRYRNGRTVEVHSTDAEGRLILADGLIYAQETLQLKRIVEFSTLTGACLRALGKQFIGGFSYNAELMNQIRGAGQDSGELVWELPLHPEYRAMLKSPIADIKNGGGALAGASTAAMFLHEFIAKGTEYCHLDIAGVFLADKVEKYWGQPGSTGPGVRLAVHLAEQLSRPA